jgi:hypothetical protein
MYGHTLQLQFRKLLLLCEPSTVNEFSWLIIWFFALLEEFGKDERRGREASLDCQAE